MRGIRGAITVDKNQQKNIIDATTYLLKKMITENRVKTEEMVSIIFTMTSDLDQVYPAVAARQLGYTDVPLLCYQELKVSDSLSRCIRIMMYINRNCRLDDIHHIYLKEAQNLRPDLREEKKRGDV